MTGPTDLTAQWRDEADTLRRRGAEAQAGLLELCVDELFAFGQESIMAESEEQP